MPTLPRSVTYPHGARHEGVVSSKAGIGYVSGDGGAVTQLTGPDGGRP